MTRPNPLETVELDDRRTARVLLAPALAAIALTTLFPIGWTAWESLHRHDLRMPWLGRPFVGLDNYLEALGDLRFWHALGHTAFFTAGTVILELALGLGLALLLHRPSRGRAALRATALLPWALPTVVTALVWRFMFEGQTGIVNAIAADLIGSGRTAGPSMAWFTSATAAWVPILLADVWRMTPFVAILLLAGLQQIDPALYDAARLDGAGSWRGFREITLPLLRPALVVAVLFRALDAFRVFDLVFVLTAGGPGTATEPISMYAFTALLRNLRFGFGSAVSMLIFAMTFAGALLWIRWMGASLTGDLRERA